MKSVVLQPTEPLWRDILVQHRHDVYHTPEYALLEARRTGCTAEAITVTDGARTLFISYLLRSWGDPDSGILDVVSPYGYPGPIATDGDASFLAAAMSHVRSSFAEKGVCSAFLRCHPLIGPDFSEIPLGDTMMSGSETVFIDLSLTERKLWTTTRKGHQSTINRCLRSGQKFSLLPYQECRRDFLAIYQQTMDQAGADQSYFFDVTYFDALARLNGAHWAVVELESDIIAACLLFEHHGIVQAHLGGTRSDSHGLSPFSLLLHEARLWAKSRGNETFHLGGGVGGARDSVLSFKAGFSRERSEYVVLRMVIDRELYAKLVQIRAEQLDVDEGILLASGFFPAYRYTPAPFTE